MVDRICVSFNQIISKRGHHWCDLVKKFPYFFLLLTLFEIKLILLILYISVLIIVNKNTDFFPCETLLILDGQLDTFADKDECTDVSHSCSKHSECVNARGGHFCRCLPGWIGDGKTCKGWWDHTWCRVMPYMRSSFQNWISTDYIWAIFE